MKQFTLAMIVVSVVLTGCSSMPGKSFSFQPSSAADTHDVMRAYAQWLQGQQHRKGTMAPPMQGARLPARMAEI